MEKIYEYVARENHDGTRWIVETEDGWGIGQTFHSRDLAEATARILTQIIIFDRAQEGGVEPSPKRS
jgi:hypothetical protein